MVSRLKSKRIIGWFRRKTAAKVFWPSTTSARRISKASSMASPQRPDVDELLARAREIAGIARERARETEAARRVSDDMIARLRQADLFRIMQPRAFGGFEDGFAVFVQCQMTVAGGCGSTGWVFGLLGSQQWLIACLSPEAQDEIWHDRTALSAGPYTPIAQAIAFGGGYKVSGAGYFCSGCDNAQWQFFGGMIPQA